MINAGVTLLPFNGQQAFDEESGHWTNILVNIFYPAGQTVAANLPAAGDYLIEATGRYWEVVTATAADGTQFRLELLCLSHEVSEEVMPEFGTSRVGIVTPGESSVVPYWNATFVSTEIHRIAALISAELQQAALDAKLGLSGNNVTIPGRLRVGAVQEEQVVVEATTANTTIDLSQGNNFLVRVKANTALAFVNAPLGGSTSFSIETVNDGTAGRGLSMPNTVKWAGNELPPRTTKANGRDVWTFFTSDSGTTFTGSLSIKDC